MFRARNFPIRSEILRQKSAFVFFRVQSPFSYFSRRVKGFFRNVRLKAPGFSKSFQQSLAKCIQDVEDSVLVFFSFLKFFLGTWDFCRSLGQKTPAVFSKQLNTCAEEQFDIFSLRKGFFISLLWAEDL